MAIGNSESLPPSDSPTDFKSTRHVSSQWRHPAIPTDAHRFDARLGNHSGRRLFFFHPFGSMAGVVRSLSNPFYADKKSPTDSQYGDTDGDRNDGWLARHMPEGRSQQLSRGRTAQIHRHRNRRTQPSRQSAAMQTAGVGDECRSTLRAFCHPCLHPPRYTNGQVAHTGTGFHHRGAIRPQSSLPSFPLHAFSVRPLDGRPSTQGHHLSSCSSLAIDTTHPQPRGANPRLGATASISLQLQKTIDCPDLE